jgi:hypothetical protein
MQIQFRVLDPDGVEIGKGSIDATTSDIAQEMLDKISAHCESMNRRVEVVDGDLHMFNESLGDDYVLIQG